MTELVPNYNKWPYIKSYYFHQPFLTSEALSFFSSLEKKQGKARSRASGQARAAAALLSLYLLAHTTKAGETTALSSKERGVPCLVVNPSVSTLRHTSQLVWWMQRALLFVLLQGHWYNYNVAFVTNNNFRTYPGNHITSSYSNSILFKTPKPRLNEYDWSIIKNSRKRFGCSVQ